MTKRYNTSANREPRRALRNNPTAPEFQLWQRLRRRNFGIKFRRQFGVDEYILDFYAPALKLAIEVDGDSHYSLDGQRYDARRTERLRELGIRVLRLTNAEVVNEIDDVLELIYRAIEQLARR